MKEIERKALESRKALIQVAGVDAGILEMIATDEYSFQYLGSYCGSPERYLPVSLTLPVRAEAYITAALHPFFDNLLFEGEQLRLAEKKYKLSRHSRTERFKLLMITGQKILSPVRVLPLIGGNTLDLSSLQ